MSLARNRMGEYSGEVNVVHNFSNDDELLLEVLMKDIKDDHFESSAAVPYEDIIRAVDFLPYGNQIRIMIKWAFETGCRLSELDRMDLDNPKISFFKNGRQYWRVGKNQKGQWRNEPISKATFEEFVHYRKHHKIMGTKCFAIKSTTFRSDFNKFVRPHLGPRWNEKKPEPKKYGAFVVYEFQLQLKGLRKSWATLTFAQLIDRWNGSIEAAMAFIAKRMHHSSHQITCTHYLESFQALNIEKWKHYSPGEILAMANQTHLVEYEVQVDLVKVIYNDPQPPLQDWMLGGKGT